MDAGDGKVARNGGYLCSGRSMASGGRFYGSLSWYSRGGELCVERRCSRMGSCGCLAYTNVLEDRGDDIGIFDAGDDAQFAAALGVGLDVDGEDAFQAPHPGHGGKGLIRLFVARFAFWHDGLAMLAIRREHAVEPGEVRSRTRDQRRQAGDEVEWARTTWVEPSRNGCLNRWTTCPRSLVESRSLAMAGRAMWRQSFSSLSRWAASQTVAAWSEKPG